MKIEKNFSEGKLTLKPFGRLDTVTSPELDAVIDECISDAKELIIDCSQIEYISSAGLRVLLKVQKIMNSNGTMKLTGVKDAVMEIFEITGFIDILTIE